MSAQITTYHLHTGRCRHCVHLRLFLTDAGAGCMQAAASSAQWKIARLSRDAKVQYIDQGNIRKAHLERLSFILALYNQCLVPCLPQSS